MSRSFSDVQNQISNCIRRLPLNAPVDIYSVARHFGVAEIEPRIMNVDGYLARRADGKFAIRYRKDQSQCRARFTIAHEIGHILHALLVGRHISGILARGEGRNNEDERLANFAAAELLMPEAFVSNYLRSSHVNWGSIWGLSAVLNVSRAASIRRITELKGLTAIEAHITWVSSFPQMRVRQSRTQNLLFRVAPQKIAAQILEEMRTQTVHFIPATLGNRDIRLRCAGRLEHGSIESTYRLIGWETE